MPRILLINQQGRFRRVAHLEGNQVVDIDLEVPFLNAPSFSSLDQIYWGRILRVESTHAFVKLPGNQTGLLPSEHSFPSPIEGQAILVQVRREAIPDKGTSHKGPILTRKIILGGRYCLLHPFQKKLHLSSRIYDPSTKKRLHALFSKNEPITLRESAAHALTENIQSEVTMLNQKFSDIESLHNKAPCATPFDAMLSSHRWMRDLDAIEGNMILVDDDKALKEVRDFLKTHRPDLLPQVHKHKSPLFEAYGLEEFWDSLFEDIVNLQNGGNIVIDTTAAAIVIDVNQGNKGSAETNKEAIPIIIQQLKGRHLGGNIIIDLIGIETAPQERNALIALLQKCAAAYHLPLDIFGWSKLGWIEARLPRRRMSLSMMKQLNGSQ